MPLVKAPGVNVIVRLSSPKTPVIDVPLRVAVISFPTMLTFSFAVSTMLVFTSTFSVGYGVVNVNSGAFVSVTPPPPEVVYSTVILVIVGFCSARVNVILEETFSNSKTCVLELVSDEDEDTVWSIVKKSDFSSVYTKVTLVILTPLLRGEIIKEPLLLILIPELLVSNSTFFH